MNLKEIADRFPARLHRDGDFQALGEVNVRGLNDLLVFLESERFLPEVLENTEISSVICTSELATELPDHLGVLCVDSPRRVFFEFHNFLAAETDFYGADFPTEISEEAQVSLAASIAEKNVRIGPGVVIEPNATVLEGSVIERDVILRAGCVIGSQGFEFKRLAGEILPVAHAGGVWLHERVEVQANAAIDCAIFGGYTEIGEDTKIDNLVHVAHKVQVGRRCLIVATAMIGGSVVIGDDVWIGPGAKISNQIVIGSGASVSLGSTVTKDVPAGARVTGNFAIPHQTFLAALKRTLREN